MQQFSSLCHWTAALTDVIQVLLIMRNYFVLFLHHQFPSVQLSSFTCVSLTCPVSQRLNFAGQVSPVQVTWSDLLRHLLQRLHLSLSWFLLRRLLPFHRFFIFPHFRLLFFLSSLRLLFFLSSFSSLLLLFLAFSSLPSLNYLFFSFLSVKSGKFWRSLHLLSSAVTAFLT